MGWFLRKKRRKKRKSSKGSRGRTRPWDPGQTLGMVRLMMIVGVSGLLFSGWQWSAQSLRAYVGVYCASVVTVDHVDLEPAPLWMSALLKDELCRLVVENSSADPLDSSSLRRAAQKLEASAWVSKVHQLRRQPGGRVLVNASYRQPVALVHHRDGYRPVDVHGVRLPGLYMSHQVKLVGLPVIEGIAARPSQPGLVWPGQDIGAALKLVMLLSGESYEDQIQAYDAGHRDSRGRLRLILHTRDGGKVHWGLPPGEPSAIEPSEATKMRRLTSVNQRRGSIDAGGKIVDLSGAAVFVHQPTKGDLAREIDYTW